ncbi:flagellar basal body-associated FliL family protein [Sinirhodobacter populi]|uniref:Flagellar protein FliL n=1 Tax=Paenirhodobacter populi TaxID=2306993 RepID=A0A443KDH6_9RHOB|nr:flagellar basal body-associated FliL family protein [Sinirhodobacter populi]RWR30848.1 flagellar basal body-associated FliL family protein [Sinirhodobacter populi]
MRKILPVIMVVLGIAVGGAAGWFLRPAPAPVEEACAEDCPPVAVEDADASVPSDGHSDPAPSEFVKLNNQFIVPDIRDGAVSALVVLSLSVEVGAGQTEQVYTLEPKLRDMLLQVLFDHANAGGFRGDFTAAGRMEELRRALLEASRSVLGKDVRSVLISDIVRQDMA